MKQLLITTTMLFISVLGFSQTVYLLDSSHHYKHYNGNIENVENNYYEYDANGLKVFFHENAGTAFGGSLTDFVSEETYTYNADNLLVHLLHKRFYSGVIDNIKEGFFKYNNSNQLTSDTLFITNANNVVSIYETVNRSYDNNDRLVQRLTKTVAKDEEITYYYTGNSTLIDSLIIKLNNQGIYKVAQKYFYTYNAQGLRTNTLVLSYDANGQGSNQYRYEYFYDANGNNTRRETQVYNTTWVDYHAFNWGYTSNNLTTKQVGYNFSSNGWTLNDSTLYFYDVHDNMTHKEVFKTPNSVLEFHDDYYYSPLLTNTTSIKEENNIQIMPNPYQTFMPLRITGIEKEQMINLQLFDLQGRVVFSNRFTNGQNIVVDKDLTSGIYILSVSNKEGQILKSQQIFVY